MSEALCRQLLPLHSSVPLGASRYARGLLWLWLPAAAVADANTACAPRHGLRAVKTLGANFQAQKVSARARVCVCVCARARRRRWWWWPGAQQDLGARLTAHRYPNMSACSVSASAAASASFSLPASAACQSSRAARLRSTQRSRSRSRRHGVHAGQESPVGAILYKTCLCSGQDGGLAEAEECPGRASTPTRNGGRGRGTGAEKQPGARSRDRQRRRTYCNTCSREKAQCLWRRHGGRCSRPLSTQISSGQFYGMPWSGHCQPLHMWRRRGRKRDRRPTAKRHHDLGNDGMELLDGNRFAKCTVRMPDGRRLLAQAQAQGLSGLPGARSAGVNLKPWRPCRAVASSGVSRNWNGAVAEGFSDAPRLAGAHSHSRVSLRVDDDALGCARAATTHETPLLVAAAARGVVCVCPRSSSSSPHRDVVWCALHTVPPVPLLSRSLPRGGTGWAR